MAKQLIGLGTTANDGTGSPLRTGGEIVNDNFTELYDRTDGNIPHQVIPAKVIWANLSATVQEQDLIWTSVNADLTTIVKHNHDLIFRTVRKVYGQVGSIKTYDVYETYWRLRDKLTVIGGSNVSLGSGNTQLNSTNGIMTFAGRKITKVVDGVIQEGGFTVDFGATGATPIEDSVNSGASYETGKGLFLFKGNDGTDDYLYIYNGVEEKIGLGSGVTTSATDFSILSEGTSDSAPTDGQTIKLQGDTGEGEFPLAIDFLGADVTRDPVTDHAIVTVSGGSQTLQQVTTAGATTTDAITVEQINVNKSAAAEEYEVSERGVSLGFPVPTIRPTTADTVIAFDIMPNGSPSDFSTNGVAWLDIVNTDLKDDNASPASAFRAGISTTQVTMGSISFFGASIKEFVFVLGTINDEVGRIKTDGILQWEKNVVIDTDTDIPTLTTQSDVANGTLSTFISTLTYDGGRFQNATRLSAQAGDLVLQASSASTDIVFIAGAGFMSTNEVARMKANGRLQFPAGQTKYADDAAAGVGGLVAGEVYATATGELRIKL